MSTTSIMISDLICQNESTIQFDKEFVSGDFTIADIDFQNCNFGIMNLKIKKTEPILQKRHIVFSIDCSGSMSDICEDGKSKMDHIIHTLINMIVYFAEHPELNISISVFAFDGSIYNIIVNEEVKEENLEKLIQCVKKIRPKGVTSIELALVNSSEYIETYLTNNSETYVSHILMTDGDATQGKKLSSELIELASPLISNIFIGFGIDHNAYLLKDLSSHGENKYYFVDALEKAGFVYGEILHSIIYRVLENTTITVINGLIYDWKKNTWVDKIEVGDLLSENKKIFQVLSNKPNEFSCLVQTRHCASKEAFEFSIQNNELNEFIDLIEYKYRQRTQQLLYEVNTHNFNIYKSYDYNCQEKYKNLQQTSTFLKEKMKDLLNEMKNIEEEQNSTFSKCEKSGVLKLLCDDIYICLRTFETKHSAIYSCARQISQGAQRSYSATYTPKLYNNNDFGNPILTRSYAANFDYLDENIDNNNNDLFPELPDFAVNNVNSLYLKKPQSSSNNNLTDIDDYEVSDQTDNPYSTLSVLSLMRSCSANIDDNKLFK